MSENLWALREQKKLSVATLASRAGLPIGLIMEYESGQRGIDVRHISRLARALYVEDSDIKLRSDPRPGAAALERQPRRDEGSRPAEPAEPPATPASRPPRDRSPRPPRPAPAPRPPLPARPSQITHLQDLLARLGRPQAEVEAELGKPLTEIDRLTASQLLVKLQTEMKEGKFPERHRAYLPEAVDQFELRYLSAAQQAGDVLVFTLFDSTTVAGRVIGFGQYNITVQTADGNETTLNKLAIVSYTRPAPGKEQPV
jgi:transcriptional regulator with XRE-family HTH domain